LLRNICNKGIVLEQGRLVHAGDIVSSLKCYHDLLADLRAQKIIPLAAADGASGAQIYGAAESITMRDGAFVLKGWFVNTEGAVPGGVVMEVQGRRYIADKVEHHRRPDVVRHLGLSDEDCGFHATVTVPGARKLADLGENVQVFGGDSPEHADAPLRIAPEFLVQRPPAGAKR
jgi:hypothetical protein